MMIAGLCLIGTMQDGVSATPAVTGSQALLAQVSAYLNGLKTITARFMQVGPDGSVRTGKAIVQRPGKMRFQYDKPNPQLLVAGFGLLVYHDPQLNQTTNIPLSSTPLGILLAKTVQLSGPVTVTRVAQPPGEIQVTLIRTGKAAQGHITLVFSTDPLELRQWRVTDAQGQITQVSLYDLHATKPFPDKDFEYVQGFSHN
ncbi:outer membrane lipoprotein carrier protein LolA [Acidiphilium sp. AL]|uniref:Outer membrane lipoprotein carrier protein LolA n=1 Tax=Acidiphilium iwatense TaxID=768198 RepID=A0ABS9DT24_9PROT|nr:MULTISPECIES: outer membrane lipoprotein carrier protein LolA [Acidiphilium]MCF3945889.1 outer membrane lipoprotein carrier protein LolA [Acidiphilium iwatense]MCU4159230.1 outer membrane lipoprotein carrier protein LolA [Acidiphilium sp. AL]